jgi:ParB-like chromosome segregation protein Spo0J
MTVTSQSYDAKADISELVEHPRNPRRGVDAVVSRSITANGFYGAIIAHSATGYVLAGHTRRRALLAQGTTIAPVLWVECDDRTATRILLADNKTAELAEWDNDMLAEMLRDMGETEYLGAGFTTYDLEALARQLDEFEPELTDERADVAKKEITCPACSHVWTV